MIVFVCYKRGRGPAAMGGVGVDFELLNNSNVSGAANVVVNPGLNP